MARICCRTWTAVAFPAPGVVAPRQPRDVDGDPPRLVLRQHLGLQGSGFVRGDMAPAAGTANTAGLQRWPVEILQTTNDPRPREPGDLGHSSDAAPSRGPRLAVRAAAYCDHGYLRTGRVWRRLRTQPTQTCLASWKLDMFVLSGNLGADPLDATAISPAIY